MTAAQALKEMRSVLEGTPIEFGRHVAIRYAIFALEAELAAKNEVIAALSDDADRLRRELDDANGVIR